MSSQIILSNLSFSYSSAIDVLKDVNIKLTPGWTGVIGNNGSGKTTLLRILAKEINANNMISYIPDDPIIQYCPQRVDKLTEIIETFSGCWDGNALRLMGELRLMPEELTKWNQLSPGERKRWQIAAALYKQPDLFLLDEPTNHLDRNAKNLLNEALNRYKGIGVLVSHDRDLLDFQTNSTVRILPGGKVSQYSLPYSKAREVWLGEESRIKNSREQLRSEQRKLKRRLDTARRSREKAESSMITGKRSKGIHDTDARSMAAKGRVINAEQKLGREVTVLKGKLERKQEAVDNIHIEKEIGRSVFVLEEISPKPELVWLKNEKLYAGDKLLVKDVDVLINRESRIRLDGLNGSGKTTLIQTLIEVSNLPDDRILFLPQELSSGQISKMLKELELLPPKVKGRLMQIVAALGVPPERIMATDIPSPGEARKLYLAMGLSKQAWLLMLDEPTNHLDLPSIERLEEAFLQYSGALLLVSHDDRFALTLTNEIWTIENQKLTIV